MIRTEASASDLAAWLEARKLGRIAPLLAGHDIDREVLARLTDADLRELGLSLGLRRKLLAALAAERAEAGPGADRRPLTVMFCDLADSTALATRLDPEDLADLLRGYRACCADILDRLGGRIARHVGDGLLVYFGHPQADEQDPDQAVRAALAIVQAVPALPRPPGIALAVRVGIATGVVVVGEPIGEGGTQEPMAVGDTVNLAARLQAIAAPGAIAIADSTRRLIGGRFRCVDLGPQQLKGFTEPVPIWQVTAEDPAVSRFDALRGAGYAPLIGRADELGRLRAAWAEAAAGRGRVVLIAGEAGIGKSRVVRALAEALAGSGHREIAQDCLRHQQATALHPVIARLQTAAGFDPGEPPAAKLDKLAALMRPPVMPAAEAVPLYAALLSIPLDDRYAPPGLPPSELKAATLQLLLGQLAAWAGERPALCLFEDVHWADPTTLELIRLIGAAIGAQRILLVLTVRPGFAPELAPGTPVTRLDLGRLPPDQAAEMVTQRAAGRPLAAPVVAQILAKADGVPLFLEELTATVLGSEQRVEGTASAVPLAVPSTLQGSLMARLDQMSAVKQVAQLAAVLGRSFAAELLRAVSPLPPQRVDDALAQLVAAEIILREGRPPHLRYRFKHALLQDVAYQSLLKAARREHHGRIADVLAERFPDLASVEPELLAQHLTEAGRGGAAIAYWLRAGRRATERSADSEAITLLGRGLALLDAIADPAERARVEQALRLAMVAPLTAVRGYADPDVEATTQRALALADQIGDVDQIFPILFSRCANANFGGYVDRATELAQEMAWLAERHPTLDGSVVGPMMMAIAAMYRGDQLAARPLFQQALGQYGEAHRDSAYRYGHDHRVGIEGCLLQCLWFLGHVDAAHRHATAMIEHARALGHANSLGLAYSYAAALHALSGDWPGAARQADAMLAVATDHRLSHWVASATLYRGLAAFELTGADAGLAEVEAGRAGLVSRRYRLADPLRFAYLASAHLRRGRAAEAQAALAAAWLAAADGEHRMDAELHRLRGELLLLDTPGRRDAAEGCFEAALRAARAKAARSLELRAAISLAGLWRDRGRRPQARSLLRELVDWFPPALETVDLATARALLRDMA